MMKREDLHNKYGQFSGLDNVFHEFDPINNPVINTNLAAKTTKKSTQSTRRSPSLPSLNLDNSKGLGLGKSVRGKWMSHRIQFIV